MKAIYYALGMSALCLGAPAWASDAAVEAPINKFIESFNKGDGAAAASTMTTDTHIIDEFAPYFWGGPAAFKTWAAGYDVDAAAKNITDPHVAISAPTRELVSGDHAYVIVPAVYTFKQKGVAMSETAQMTVTLVKAKDGWKINAWSWTGPDPSPAP